MLHKRPNTSERYCAKFVLIDDSIIGQQFDKILVLDRDGVIIEDLIYVNELSRVNFRGSTIKSAINYQNLGWKIAIATNQSGIARGFFTEECSIEFNLDLCKKLFTDFGLEISMLVYCPNHPEFTRECYCRKPAPGMLLQIRDAIGNNSSEFIFVGDQKSDMTAAALADVKFAYVQEFDLSSP